MQVLTKQSSRLIYAESISERAQIPHEVPYENGIQSALVEMEFSDEFDRILPWNFKALSRRLEAGIIFH